MKKIIRTLILCCLFVIIGTTPAYAANNDKVVDEADLLSDAEEKNLEDKIADLVKKYDFDIVIVTNQSLEGKTAEAYADDYFDYNGYGLGSNYDGILFLVSMEERDYHFSTCGYGEDAINDEYGIEYFKDNCSTYLSDGDYKGAFDEYVKLTDIFLKQAKTGKPYSSSNMYVTAGERCIVVFGILVISLIIGLISVSVMKSGMNNVKSNNSAREYIRKDSMKLSRQSDVFLYSNVTKTAIPKDNGGSGGGSNSHTSSSGRSHGGGGGKF